MNRPINDTQRDWLRGELNAWREMGLVGEDQALAVLSLYGTDAEAAELRQSRLLSVLLFLAALLSGLGVLLLVAYNWSGMPSALKVVLVLAAVAAAHATGLALRFRKRMGTVSEVAFFLGCLFYGAGIALIGQIFHVNANDAGAFWWWAVGVLPFALALDGLAFHVLYVGLVAVWAGYEVLGFNHLGAWLFGRWGGVPNGAYSLPALAAPGFVRAYRRHDPRLLSLYVPLAAWWVVLQPFAWRFGENPVYFIGAVGGLLLLAGDLHPRGSPLAIPYRFFGTLLVGGILVPLSFHEAHELGRGSSGGVAGPVVVVALAALLLTAVAVVLRRREAGAGAAGRLADALLSTARGVWLPVGLVVLFVAMAFWRLASGGEAFLPALAANAAMVGLAFWLMRLGLREDRGRPFGVGVAYFLLWTLLRYFDLFGNFGGMPGAALMFFLCGAALFGVALYWRRRKEVQLD